MSERSRVLFCFFAMAMSAALALTGAAYLWSAPGQPAFDSARFLSGFLLGLSFVPLALIRAQGGGERSAVLGGQE